MTRPDWCPQDVWEATAEQAKDLADWLVDAVAASTQNTAFLHEEPEEDTWATESILLNGEKAIRVAAARAILAERERCAAVADAVAAGRSRQCSAAKTAKQLMVAYDFESMAMSAIEVSYAIRAGVTH